MDHEHLQQLATIITQTPLTTMKDTTKIIEQGTEGSNMYILAQGKVNVVVDDVVVDTRDSEKGCSIFGDTSLIQKDCPRTASCVASGKSSSPNPHLTFIT